MQTLEHHDGHSTGCAADSRCSVLKMGVETETKTVEAKAKSFEDDTIMDPSESKLQNTEAQQPTDSVIATAEVETDRIAAERITDSDSNRTDKENDKESEKDRPATATSKTTTVTLNPSPTSPDLDEVQEGVDTAGVQDGDPGSFTESGSTTSSASNSSNSGTETETETGTGTGTGTRTSTISTGTARDLLLRSSLVLDSESAASSPFSPAFATVSPSFPSSFLPSRPLLSTSASSPATFTLSAAPPPKRYARVPPPIQIGGKLRNSTAFLLSPSPPQSALLSPSSGSGTLFSSPSTLSDSPSSSLFTNTASALETRASSSSSSSSSRTLTTSAVGPHNDGNNANASNSNSNSNRVNIGFDIDDVDDDRAASFFRATSDSVFSPTSPTLPAWPVKDEGVHDDDDTDVHNDTASCHELEFASPKKHINIRPVHGRSLSAGHSSIMTASAVTRGVVANRNAENNLLRASNDSNSRWRPATAKSARDADRARRRSPSPLFNPFARVARRGDDSNSSESPQKMRASTSNGRRPSYSRRGSLSSGGAPPPLTREEFEALPVAIQRKYFSTLERLRFAQGSSTIDGIYQHYDAISTQNVKNKNNNSPKSSTQQRRRARQDRIASDNITTRLRKRSLRLESSSLLSATTPSPAIGDAVADTLFYANLPDKIKKREFTREEQVALAGQLRASVILDAADEAIYKIGRRASITHRLIAPDITVDTPTTTSFRHSMETIHSASDPRLGLGRRDALGLEDVGHKRISGVPDAFYDSFRWLEEEDDLDLSLILDDYHSNLRDALPSPSKERGPFFRRHLSISKMPFSRPLPASASVGSNMGSVTTTTPSTTSRPATKDEVAPSTRTARSPSIGGGNGMMTTPFPSMPSSTFSSPTGAGSHLRRKSRTLSLITPKQHAVHDSISSIDPGAAHYQDPEARLKLRVYLASPQKFDEAIEFGFPSTEVLSSMSMTGGSPPMGSSSVLSSTATKGNRNSTATTAVEKRHTRRNTRQSTSDGTMRTFLADDDDDENDHDKTGGDDDDMTKLDSDLASVPDPESPKTPNLVDHVSSSSSRKTSSSAFRPYRISTSTDSPQMGHRPSDSYAQVPASSREMTLRMTLTRLDLRAGEDQIYGWQQTQTQTQTQKLQPQKKQFHHMHHQSSSHNLSLSSSNHMRKSSTAAALGAVGPYYPPPRKDSLLLPSSTTTTTTTTTTTATTTSSNCDATVTYLGAGAVSRPKASIEDVFAGIDHWEADQDKGVMKRFWNKVRRS